MRQPRARPERLQSITELLTNRRFTGQAIAKTLNLTPGAFHQRLHLHGMTARDCLQLSYILEEWEQQLHAGVAELRTIAAEVGEQPIPFADRLQQEMPLAGAVATE